MMKILDFKDLISNLPERNHSVTAKISTWDNRVGNLQTVFSNIVEKYKKHDDGSKLEISRDDLYKLGKSNSLDEFILATIIWGYPAGMRGRHFENILKKYEILKNLLIDKKSNGISQWQDETKLIANIQGLGISSYTKLLNFLEVQVEGQKALILDSRVTAALNSKRFSDLQFQQNVPYEKAFDFYLAYLKLIHQKATEMEVQPAQIEMFLFFFGANLKTL